VTGFIFNYLFPSHDPNPDDNAKIHEKHVQLNEHQEFKPSITILVHTATPIKI
jgi:hypothetical protein